MKREEIIKFVQNTYTGTVVNNNWGEQGIFYNPDLKLAKGIYILTIKDKDGPNDKASNLNREDVYRLNLGIKKTSFIELFGFVPQRPTAGNIVEMDYDFSIVDEILPHPVYGWMSWISVLSPSEDTFEKIKPFINEGYDLAVKKYQKKKL
ncbi:DUF6194 family protein [Sutcliffiella horikoshii]|uniref:DUF6194 family protein n=1 Tax=Sutcliffiella horikoshii TaxID=79883 RepID=UPI001CFEED15|nr:DUF6194 family protein [Sutcliffiella horikoshii]